MEEERTTYQAVARIANTGSNIAANTWKMRKQLQYESLCVIFMLTHGHPIHHPRLQGRSLHLDEPLEDSPLLAWTNVVGGRTSLFQCFTFITPRKKHLTYTKNSNEFDFIAWYTPLLQNVHSCDSSISYFLRYYIDFHAKLLSVDDAYLWQR